MPSNMRYVINQDKRGRFRWSFIAPNGKIIAVPRASFKRKDACQASIDQVKKVAPKAPVIDTTTRRRKKLPDKKVAFEVYQDGRRQYRWWLYAPGGKRLARASEGYKAKRSCLHAIALLKRNGAPIIDESIDEGDPVVPKPPRPDDKKKSGMRLPPSLPPVMHNAGQFRRGAVCAVCCRMCQTLPPALRAQCEAACHAAIPNCRC